MTEVDAQWYERHVGDPETDERRTFPGGDLASVDFELDALWNGVPWEVRRRELEAQVKAAVQLLALFGGHGEPVSPPSSVVEVKDGRHTVSVGLDTTAWLEAFEIILSENWPSNQDPAKAVDFKLDVLRAMRHLSRNYRRAVVHAMDGFDHDEIAGLMGWVDDDGEPNVDSSERVVRRSSTDIRRHLSLDIPGEKRKRVPQAPKHPTGVATQVESEIEEIRAWRKRELRRQERSKTQRRVA